MNVQLALTQNLWAALNYADLRVRRSATSRDSEHVLSVCWWAFHMLGPHTAVTHQPANGIMKEKGWGPGLSQSRQLKAPLMCGPASPGCGEQRKVMDGPVQGAQIPGFVLISGTQKASAAGALSHGELRAARMSPDKCLLDT